MDDSPFVCVRCAASNPTCCRTDPAHSDKCFPLSEAERARMLPHAERLGVPASAVEANTPDFLRLMGMLFPDRRRVLARVFPPQGRHLRLPLSEDGRCLFLQDDGCFLPRDARPWYCQLFPLWVRENFFDRFVPESCLLTREARGLRDVFTILGISRGEAKAFYLSLCRDWEMENDDEA